MQSIADLTKPESRPLWISSDLRRTRSRIDCEDYDSPVSGPPSYLPHSDRLLPSKIKGRHAPRYLLSVGYERRGSCWRSILVAGVLLDGLLRSYTPCHRVTVPSKTMSSSSSSSSSTPMNKYWIPHLDIHKRVITREIQFHLGPQATVRPYTREVRT